MVVFIPNVCLCVCTPHYIYMCTLEWESVEGKEGAGVGGSCERPNMAARMSSHGP